MNIIVDDLSGGEVIALLEEHLADMYATSPAESVHALDVDALKAPEIKFYSAWNDNSLLGCIATKRLTARHIELKSMRTVKTARNLGVASKLLSHVLELATQQGYLSVSLETGSQDYFLAARNLYQKHGFEYCGPFAHYTADPNSRFMTKTLTV
ncbi:GNAT family N-acetyltransferase [Reinekea forsetii]|nr:GNAT family N-acetyltransferase [Reinekea forsetii]